ncbi:type I restriction enzyme HsdR N-terminal domain-containing protein [Paludibacter propionicigenes]|uniref:type I restriction enzyme HsdR N-terminal domain-containing protein n=1 Tax=Paludibacter propionicigenes TaxID=185300 RepID=UPI001FE198AD|nr:type I restriction enzyme HsdR N-terminal domain-containing protein [Paludibacter propionicigenes]
MGQKILIIFTFCRSFIRNVPISQSTFDQVAVYNSKLNVDLFIVSNGIEHFCCKVNTKTAQYEYFSQIPDYSAIKGC